MRPLIINWRSKVDSASVTHHLLSIAQIESPTAEETARIHYNYKFIIIGNLRKLKHMTSSDNEPDDSRISNIECPECSDSVRVTLPSSAGIASITASKSELEHDVDQSQLDHPRDNTRQCPCYRKYNLSILYE